MLTIGLSKQADMLLLLALVTFGVVFSDPLVRRNVKDFGAVGDGVTDDTAAFILALTQEKATYNASSSSALFWNESQYNCQTTMPSIVIVPPGTYLISALLPLTYYTQLVGNASDRAVLHFVGHDYHCMDAGIDEGPNHGWYGGANQDNFFHQVRNLVLDLSMCLRCVAIHWQVSQATNLVNLDFQLGYSGMNNTGVLMEDGSGGYFGDVAFTGGQYAMQVGNQQFTIRNVSITGAEYGIFMFWNWVWSFHDIRITNTTTGVYMTAGVRSVSFVDVYMEHVVTGFYCNDTSPSGTQILLDHANMSYNVQRPLAINGSEMIVSAADAYNFAYSRIFNGSYVLGPVALPPRPESLLMMPSGKWFGRTRPNYNTYVVFNATNFTDVTADLQAFLYANVGEPIFVPYGTYFVSDTIRIPTGTRLFGEVWTRFAAVGSAFANASAPRAAFQVGDPGDVGVVELADLLFTTRGPAPGAILLSWHTAGASAGDCGIWDVHYRIGGAVGTDVNDTICNVNATMEDSPSCIGVHTLFHIQPNASVYVENMWGWVADHDIDRGSSLNMFNARGLVVETQNPVWLYGTAMEHSYLFQYNLCDSANTLLSIIQTETAYYQPQFSLHPSTPTDPLFPHAQRHGYSIVARRVADTVLYGAGMYSFFYRWSTAHCGSDPMFCQNRISSWTTAADSGAPSYNGGPGTPSGVRLHNFNTHAAETIVQWNFIDVAAVNASNGFCDTISLW